MTLNRLAGRFWSVGPTDLGLSGGVSGIALFLAELDAVIDEPRYREVTESLTAVLFDPAEQPDVEDLRGNPIGLFEDLGSLLWLVARLDRLWHAPHLLDATAWLVPAVRANLDSFGDDVVGGAAGAVLALLAARERRPGAAIDDAIRAAAKVLTGRTTEGAASLGFGRGVAGIAFALAQAGAALGDDSLMATGMRLLSGRADELHRTSSLGWCRGLAGEVIAAGGLLSCTGLSRWRDMADTVLDEAVGVLLRLLGERGAPTDDSLCHGTLAVAQALTVAGRRRSEPELIELAGGFVAGAVRRVADGGPISAVPSGLWVPGLRHGASGVGWGLLRLAEPDRVADVLTGVI